MADMTKILDLVKAGRLTDATMAIQTRLAAATPEPTFERPMRDVTPKVRALSGPATPPTAPKPARSKPSHRKMEHVDGPIPYRLFHPATPVATAPLIVMLHGCTQTPESFATGTRMNAAAEAIGAHVIWPEQLRQANPNGCWTWFDPAHQGRSGEPAALAALTRAVHARVAPEASGIHVAGLSAGGAMAAVLGTAFPEIFASVGVHSGLPVGSAQDVPSAFAAMRSGGRSTRALPVPAIIFHGMADRTVAPANGLAVAGQPQEGLQRRTFTHGGRRTTVSVAAAADGRPAREIWQVDGLGHAWSGGDPRGTYADAAGPDATAEMLRFFLGVGREAT